MTGVGDVECATTQVPTGGEGTVPGSEEWGSIVRGLSLFQIELRPPILSRNSRRGDLIHNGVAAVVRRRPWEVRGSRGRGVGSIARLGSGVPSQSGPTSLVYIPDPPSIPRIPLYLHLKLPVYTPIQSLQTPHRYLKHPSVYTRPNTSSLLEPSSLCVKPESLSNTFVCSNPLAPLQTLSLYFNSSSHPQSKTPSIFSDPSSSQKDLLSTSNPQFLDKPVCLTPIISPQTLRFYLNLISFRTSTSLSPSVTLHKIPTLCQTPSVCTPKYAVLSKTPQLNHKLHCFYKMTRPSLNPLYLPNASSLSSVTLVSHPNFPSLPPFSYLDPKPSSLCPNPRVSLTPFLFRNISSIPQTLVFSLQTSSSVPLSLFKPTHL